MSKNVKSYNVERWKRIITSCFDWNLNLIIKSIYLIITSVSMIFFFLWLFSQLIWYTYMCCFKGVNYTPLVAVHICFAFMPILNHTEIYTQDHSNDFNIAVDNNKTSFITITSPSRHIFLSFVPHPPWLRSSHTSLIYSSTPSCQPATAATPKSQSLIYYSGCKETARTKCF